MTVGRPEKRQLLFELLDSLEEPTLIYCSAPDRAVSLVADFLASDYKNRMPRSAEADAEANRIIRWLKRNVHPDWVLCEALRHGIAFHHGGL